VARCTIYAAVFLIPWRVDSGNVTRCVTRFSRICHSRGNYWINNREWRVTRWRLIRRIRRARAEVIARIVGLILWITIFIGITPACKYELDARIVIRALYIIITRGCVSIAFRAMKMQINGCRCWSAPLHRVARSYTLAAMQRYIVRFVLKTVNRDARMVSLVCARHTPIVFR